MVEPLKVQAVDVAVQVICNGEEVLTVSGTKEKYVVDVWSGNHPFFKVCAQHASPFGLQCGFRVLVAGLHPHGYLQRTNSAIPSMQ